MEYFVLIVTSVSIGLILRYSMPGRQEYGLLLAPSIALATCLVVWSVGLLFGMNDGHFLLWIAALIASGLVAFLVIKFLPAKRIAAYEADLVRLLQR